jgi:hypothetical protein
MRAKQAFTFLLTGFVIVAIAFVVIGDYRKDAPATEGVVAAAVAPANPSPAEASEPTAAALRAEVTSEAADAVGSPPPVPAEAVAVTPEPVKALPVTPKGEPAASVAAAAPQQESRRVVATYFHGNVRCYTCRKVEEYAREAVEEGFRREIAEGLVEFRAINVEEPANRHYVQDYRLMTRSVVVTSEVDGAVEQWTRLDQVWTLVGNRGAYVDYVQDAVRGYLEIH